ncbi:MAG: hypothetical protein A2W23_06000, partial [Planctomycetes bacterium RBG_16_43_13]
MIRALMFPLLSSFRSEESGIKQVVLAYHKYGKNFGIEYVECDPKETDNYDVMAIHAGSAKHIQPGKPLCSIIHGLYWSADLPYERWELGANADVIASIRHANQVTVPSNWVAETLRRDMRINPTVIGHGIDWQDWQHNHPNEGYVLWNKNRTSDVCTPHAVGVLAKEFPNQLFITTFAPPKELFGADNDNITVTGLKPHADMKRIIQSAGVYLSTVKETFCVGVLEAMASGVPVLGFANGGNLGLIKHGINGYLAQPGNYDDLTEGLNYCLQHRKVLGDNGSEMAKQYTWQAAVEKVSQVYRLAIEQEKQPATVSVVIPSFNYASEDKLGRAIRSALAQTYPPEQIIVVDDGSDDNGATERLVKSFSGEKIPVVYIRQNNSGVAVARNTGIEYSSSKFIVALDADDKVEPQFIEVCVPELQKDRSLGIAYTRLQYIKPDGETGVSPWPGPFDYDKQSRRQNQVPTACVFRREMWERLGGYNPRYAPTGAGSEDAEFWLRCGAYGWGAKLATDLPLFVYSWLSGRVSGNKDYREPDWLGLHPWAKDGQHPFASVATPKNGISHLVRAYDEPLVSVIVPVGPNHVKDVVNVLDSLESQSFRKWEVIIVDDTGDIPLLVDGRVLKPYPYVRYTIPEHHGAGAARNAGAKIARAPMLLFLDADDWLYPEALRRMYDMWTAENAIIYTDYVGKAYIEYQEATKLGERLLYYDGKRGEAVVRHNSLEYDYDRAIIQPRFPDPYIWCLISSLVPKKWHEEIGGFDEHMESWEDWDYWIRMAHHGKCFVRIPEELMVYRFYTGTRREIGLQEHRNLVEYLIDKYEGVEPMGCNCRGKNKSIAQQPAAQQIQQQGAAVMNINDNEMVLVLYAHPNIGQHHVIGMGKKPPTDYGYRGGGDKFYVHRSDIAVQPHLFKPIIMEATVVADNPEPLSPPEPIAQETKPNGRAQLSNAKHTIAKLQDIPGITDQVARSLNAIGVHDPQDVLRLGVMGL